MNKEEKIKTVKNYQKNKINLDALIEGSFGEFRKKDDKIWAMHIEERTHKNENNRCYFSGSEIQHEALRLAGFRFCFKSLEDIQRFLDHIKSNLKRHKEYIDEMNHENWDENYIEGEFKKAIAWNESEEEKWFPLAGICMPKNVHVRD